MSEESTTPDLEEMVRRAAEAVNGRDIDALVAMFAPDGVWDASPAGLGLFEGHAAIRGLYHDWYAAYDEYEHVVDEFGDLGNGVSLAVYLERGRPRASSGFVDIRFACVVVWTDSLIERLIVYTDIDEARAAAERLAHERG